FNGLPQMGQMGAFPYGNPLLAMGGMNLNPLLMTPNSAALAQFANPAAALSTLAAQTSQAPVVNVGSPALNATPSPNATSGKLASPQNGGITPPSPSNAERWCRENLPDCLDANEWPANSPNLDFMEDSIWAILEEKACGKRHSSVDALKSSFKKAWEEIPQEMLRAAVPVSLSANLPGATGASGEEIRLKTEKEEPVEVNGQGENELNGNNNDE
ncbi:hypothetical protein ANCDUO_06958, partial [Ancylostoma duodenale]